ncbi:hypothetical protein EON77_16100, partial [bacterium]
MLLNAAALAGLLAAFSSGIAAFNSNRLRSELVDDLRRRGDDAARGPRRPKPPVPPGAPGPPVPKPDLLAEAIHLNDVRRPRSFDAQGDGDVSLDPTSLRTALAGRPAFGEAKGLLVYA